MDRKSFQALFPQEDPQLTARLYGLIEQAFASHPVVSKEFYTPEIWRRLEEREGYLPSGGGFYSFLECDRRLFAWPLELAEESFRLLEVKNLFPQRSLAHGDYLGALMNLGIRREKFSDLFVQGDHCIIPMISEILPYVMDNLQKVGNNGVVLREVDPAEVSVFTGRFTEMTMLVASMRLDVLVSEITGLSRGKADEFLKQGKVKLNYVEWKDRSRNVQTGDILTLRGYGKYRVGSIEGETRKGRLRLSVEKYL